MTQCTQNFFLTHYTKLLVYCLQLLTCVGLFLHTLLRGLSFILSNVLAFPMRVTDRIADLSELITVMVIYDWHFCSFCLFVLYITHPRYLFLCQTSSFPNLHLTFHIFFQNPAHSCIRFTNISNKKPYHSLRSPTLQLRTPTPKMCSSTYFPYLP